MRSITLGATIASISAGLAIMPAVLVPAFADIYWQIAEGRAIIAGHFPTSVPNAIHAGLWIDHEWLFEVLAAFAYDRHAYYLLVGLCALAAAAIPLLIFFSVRRGAETDFGAGIAAFASFLMMCKYDAVRPLQFGVLGSAVFLYMLRTRRGNWPLYVVLAAVWANLHASVVLAPMLCAIFCIAAFIEKEYAFARRSAGYTLAALAGSIASPSSFQLYTYALAHAGIAGSSTKFIGEWNPLALESAFDFIAFGVVFLAVLAGLCSKKASLADRCIAAVFTLMALHQQRHVAFLAVACAGIVAHCMPRFGGIQKSWFEPLVAGVLLAVGIVEAPLLARADPMQIYPQLESLFTPLMARTEIANAYIDYNIAGYAAFRNAPLKVLIDSHADCFGPDVFSDWLSLLNLTPGWQQVLQRNRITIVVVKKQAAIAQALALLPNWQRIAERDDYVIFSEGRERSKLPDGAMPSTSPSSIRSDEIRSRASATMPRYTSR